ncbi:hypothetical protein GCM10010094_23450 [Streptomyces flaveus]|uniref:RNA polymerase sigma-70 region 2 domain-containing protein n=1 Tax=Streptomyces flaveus TaxID=66370 RepID=A0A917QPT2_9ACTN|nr:hypothetical protein GCM10010094_23450 [Streptomyces flaveus]
MPGPEKPASNRWRAVAEPLHRYLLRRADVDAADDILAETMLVLWRRLEDVPGLGKGPVADPDGVPPWCYGVARGCLSNARRAEGRRLRLVERLTRTAPPPKVADRARARYGQPVLYPASRSGTRSPASPACPPRPEHSAGTQPTTPHHTVKTPTHPTT